jgi:hypothetical protein
MYNFILKINISIQLLIKVLIFINFVTKLYSLQKQII